jgi:uracil-DNA glycosylase
LDNALRLQYLEAMGIDVWVPRESRVPDSVITCDQQQIEQAHHVNAELCSLCDPHDQTLLGVGNQQADWLLVVAATSTDDMQDLPFEKNAGLLLAEMLRTIDLSVEDVFIAPLIACKAVNHDTEAQLCTGHLISQQQLIQPRIILAIGDKAAQALLKTRQPLASLRGQCHYINEIPVVVVEHPAYLLRSLLEKRQAWQDLCFAKQILNNEG